MTNENRIDVLLRRGIDQQVRAIGSPGSLGLKARERAVRRRGQQKRRAFVSLAAVAVAAPFVVSWLRSAEYERHSAGPDGPVIHHRPEDDQRGTQATPGSSGPLELEAGCLTQREPRYVNLPEGFVIKIVLVWPPGTTWDADAAKVVLADSRPVTLGSEVLSGQHYVPSEIDRDLFASHADFVHAKNCISEVGATSLAFAYGLAPAR